MTGLREKSPAGEKEIGGTSENIAPMEVTADTGSKTSKFEGLINRKSTAGARNADAETPLVTHYSKGGKQSAMDVREGEMDNKTRS